MQLVMPIKYIKSKEVLSSIKSSLSAVSSPIKIAIIEDIKEIALDLKELFNAQEGMSCTQVYHDAESAISFLSKFPADIVLCDIGLPGIDGIQAIIAIREICPQTQFCMFTVFEDNQKDFPKPAGRCQGIHS